MVRTPATPLVGRLRPARSHHRRRNTQAEEVMSTDTLQNDKVLRIERLIATTPERLFELWTDPEQLTKWWGPEDFTIPKYTMDVRPGGRWRTTMHRPDGTENVVSGIYRVIEPPRRLVFTWGW